MTTGLQRGAPGVSFAPTPPDRTVRSVRLDVTGFAGVAARGPVDRPVPVRAWSDYEQTFGGRTGPGLLPHAVAAFFAQGGELAWIVRVGPGGSRRPRDPADDPAVARFRVGPVELAAADPGSWGTHLGVELTFAATSLFPVLAPGWDVGGQASDVPGTGIAAPAGIAVPAGTLLRIRTAGSDDVFRWVERRTSAEIEPGRRVDVLVLDQEVSRPPPDHHDAAPVVAAVVTASLAVRDADARLPRDELHADLGLDPVHPRFVADVVRRDSRLVVPVGRWQTGRIVPLDTHLTAPDVERTNPGHDIHAAVDATSFIDDRAEPDPDDPAAPPLRGTAALAQVQELGLMVVPDLFWAWREDAPGPDPEPPSNEPGFVRCSPPLPATRYRPAAQTPLLDARVVADRAEMQRRQARLVELADRHRRFVVLLDVPAGMSVRDITRWRVAFDSGYAAAYHPWLRVEHDGTSVLLPPSAFAAGIVAAREIRLGLPWGPANELALTAVAASSDVTDAEHDVLHPLGVNVFRAERDGFRLTAARTLSRDRDFVQLSVRRLMTMLRLALEREARWVVFEPVTRELRHQLRHVLLAFLGGLFRLGAFAGATEAESFFVRVGDDVNPRASTELGRLVVEVGVAPAEPLEFIVVRLRGDVDGGLRAEEAGRG